MLAHGLAAAQSEVRILQTEPASEVDSPADRLREALGTAAQRVL